jgi:hypothetical protein
MGDEIQGSGSHSSRRGRLGRNSFRSSLRRRHADVCSSQSEKTSTFCRESCKPSAHMAGRVGVAWITVPFALMLSLSIAGIGSAWMGGSARIPFVAGLDSYMPSWLGKSSPALCHAHTPRSSCKPLSPQLLVIMNFLGAGVQETFQNCFIARRRPATRPVPLYVRRANSFRRQRNHVREATIAAHPVSRRHQRTCSLPCLASLVFFPAQQISSIWSYELWMFGGTLFFIGLAAFFLFRLRSPQSPGGTAVWSEGRFDYQSSTT